MGGPPGMDPAAMLGGAGGLSPDMLGGLDPSMLAGGGGGEEPGGPGGGEGSDLLSGMTSTDHIRAAVKHLMMAMTESDDDEEGHGIGKGMVALHALLAGKAKNAKTITAAGGTPAGG
jgi:hypothetical protein